MTLVVPEDRQATPDNTRVVRLPVVIVAATGPAAAHRTDPILWIDYDAGDGMLVSRANTFTEQQHPLNVTRDVITLDLRGSGHSQPNLDCPEVTALNVGAFAADVDETSPAGRAMRLAAVRTCHDRLVNAGVHLAAYASTDAAQDLDDLRKLLGIEQWNLAVGEYGSKLAQLLIRDRPATIRSVVVNAAPIPLQADYFADLANNTSRAWLALVEACQHDPGCDQAYPDLANRLHSIVQDLDATPRRVDDFDTPDGKKMSFTLTTARLLTAVIRGDERGNELLVELPRALTNPTALQPDTAATLNPFFEAAFDTAGWSSWGLWEIFPQGADSNDGTFSLGAHLSAVCRDEAPYTAPKELAAAANVPLFGPILGHNADYDACPTWDVGHADPTANQVVHSTVPTLVLAGDLDTLSSRQWADDYVVGLTAGQVVHFAGMGTQPTTGPASTGLTCARALRDAFLADPTAKLDTGCVATAHGPSFAIS